MKDTGSSKPKGFGFVCFTSHDEATRAVTEMNGAARRPCSHVSEPPSDAQPPARGLSCEARSLFRRK